MAERLASPGLSKYCSASHVSAKFPDAAEHSAKRCFSIPWVPFETFEVCLSHAHSTSDLETLVLLDRAGRLLPLLRGAPGTSSRPLGFLRHPCFAVQLLVCVDNVCLFS